MSADSTGSALPETLNEFRVKANDHPRVRGLLNGWQPVIVIEAVDTGNTWYMPVRDCQVSAVERRFEHASHVVHLRATGDILTSIFKGASNPAEAFLNGELEIFASDKDQVKLDAISLVLWGM